MLDQAHFKVTPREQTPYLTIEEISPVNCLFPCDVSLELTPFARLSDWLTIDDTMSALYIQYIVYKNAVVI